MNDKSSQATKAGLKPLRVGLWGGNGHQIHGQLANYPRLESVDGGARTRLVVGKDDRGAIDTSAAAKSGKAEPVHEFKT